MNNEQVIDKLDQIIDELEERRGDLKQQFKRTDIKPNQLVDFRVQVNAQLSLIDDAIRRLLGRLRDRKLIKAADSVKPLSSAKTSAMQKALEEVQKAIQITATIRDIASAVSRAVVASARASDAAKPEKV